MIMDILQDRQGFLWVSTWDGLYRHDGYQFKKYTLDSIPVFEKFPYLPSTGKLLEDRDGNIWVTNTYALGGSYAKIHMLDPRQDTCFVFNFSFTASPWNFNEIFLEDQMGNIWVRSSDGLRKISKSNKDGEKYDVEWFSHREGEAYSLADDTVSSIILGLDKRLWVATTTGLHFYDYKASRIRRVENLKVQAPIVGLCELSTGNMALGTKGNGLFILDKQGNIIDHYTPMPDQLNALKGGYIKYMLADARGQLWLITTDQKSERYNLQRFEPHQKKFFSHYLPPFETAGFLAVLMGEPFYMFADYDGTVWMNNSNSLYHYLHKEDRFIGIESPESISWRSGVAFLRDKSRVLWIGTAGNGLLRYAPSANQFTVFQHRNNLPLSISSNAAVTVKEDSKGHLWVATQDAGADRLTLNSDNVVTEVIHYSTGAPAAHRIPGNNMTGMEEDAAGNMWLCTTSGSASIHPLTGAVIKGRHFPFGFEARNDIRDKGVRFFRPDLTGNIWTITLKNELACFNEQTHTWKFFTADPKQLDALFSNQISAFFIDKQNDVWVGTRQGLCRYNHKPGNFTRYLGGAAINGLYRTQGDRLWVTIHGGGLVLLDIKSGKVLRRFRIQDGYPSNRPKGILADDTGKLWIGSDCGLICFDPSTGQSHLFDKSSGLPSEDFYYPGGCKRRNGEFAMPLASGGFILFNPEKVHADTFAPAVCITDLKLFNESQQPGGKNAPLKQTINTCKEITLAYDQNVITLEYAGLHFARPEANHYAYKMDGLDKGWNEVGNRRFTTYAGLGPGHYVFWVKAANHDGYWGQPVSLRIAILPPWWATWWAYALYALWVVAVLWAAYTWRLRRLELKTRLAQEHREAERLKELDALKTRLFTNITHEFRTPITVILGLVEQLHDTVRREGMENLAAIRRSGKALLRLVNQMLDLSKLEAGAMPLHYVHNDVIPFLRYQLETFHSLAESKGIRLLFQANPETMTADYDPEKLETIISNLLSNALKFTARGTVIMKVMPEGSIDNLSHLSTFIIKIKDTGIGIQSEKLPHIFDRFYQAEDNARPHSEGTGIGLTVSKELVKLLGGEITVTSEPGAGSEFTVRLPFRAPGTAGTAPPLPESQARAATSSVLSPQKQEIPRTGTTTLPAGGIEDDASNPLLLIVEDNADVVSYLRSLLQNSYRIEVASDGRAGLSQALEQVPDIILSDVMMPSMDGFELCQTLKTDMRTSHIPIILLTARADTASKIEGLQHGADAYMAKPFDKTELFVRLEKLVELRRRLQERYSNAFSPLATPATPTLEDEFMGEVRRMLEKHIADEGFGVPELCKALAMSRAQLYRKFHALTDQPVAHYFRAMRLHRAKTLLQTTQMHISEIAFEVGFKDPAHFTRAFKEEFGVNPGEIRK